MITTTIYKVLPGPGTMLTCFSGLVALNPHNLPLRSVPRSALSMDVGTKTPTSSGTYPKSHNQ